MSDLKVPVLSVVIGEGGSGGALALAVGNEVWMMENATYTILSPEGFASILWKDSRKAPGSCGDHESNGGSSERTGESLNGSYRRNILQVRRICRKLQSI